MSEEPKSDYVIVKSFESTADLRAAQQTIRNALLGYNGMRSLSLFYPILDRDEVLVIIGDKPPKALEEQIISALRLGRDYTIDTLFLESLKIRSQQTRQQAALVERQDNTYTRLVAKIVTKHSDSVRS